MSAYLELTADKFTFRVATDCLYNPEGVWARAEAGRVRIGMSDFLQQRSGDVAFAEVKPAGTSVAFGDEVATVETIKVTLGLPSPAAGVVVSVNPALADAPELVNQDPYGAGWLAEIAPVDWEADRARLLDAQAYLAEIRRQIAAEGGQP